MLRCIKKYQVFSIGYPIEIQYITCAINYTNYMIKYINTYDPNNITKETNDLNTFLLNNKPSL